LCASSIVVEARFEPSTFRPVFERFANVAILPANRLIDYWLVNLLTAWLVGWLVGSLTDCLIDKLLV
jgi:hypothetical protein